MDNNAQQTLDLRKVVSTLWNNRKSFYKIWVITFILSCIWILPQPRYYASEVKLAPEMNGEDVGGGLSSIASSFGFNIGGIGGQDAIYPELYPELFESPEFVVDLFDVQVKTLKGDITTDYFTYLSKYQKNNNLTAPFLWAINGIKKLFPEDEDIPSPGVSDGVNPFNLSKKEHDIMNKIINKISCSIDKKTSVISISVQDQDPLVCATMTDSVKSHLQDFIIRYRTSKAHEDVAHYQLMRDSAEMEYDKVMRAYSFFCDTHKNVILQSYQSERDKLEGELAVKQNSLTAMETQLQATKVKLQEKTPAFTTLKSATVPRRPAGPKRMMFVICMLILATTIKGFLVIKDYII